MSSLPRVVVAVVGDKGVGKTSLISTAAQEVYSDNPPPVLPPTRFPPDFHSEPTELIVYDTSSRPEDQQLMEDTVKAADAVVMCFDAMRRGTLDRLRSYWMPELLKLKPTVPVVVACCKHDDEDTVPYEDIRMVGVWVGSNGGGGWGVALLKDVELPWGSTAVASGAAATAGA